MSEIIKKDIAPFTHQLNIDVLMADLTARKIQINFNGADEWEEDCGTGALAVGDTILRFIARGLIKDKTALGWKASLMNIEQKKIFCRFAPVVKTELM